MWTREDIKGIAGAEHWTDRTGPWGWASPGNPLTMVLYEDMSVGIHVRTGHPLVRVELTEHHLEEFNAALAAIKEVIARKRPRLCVEWLNSLPDRPEGYWWKAAANGERFLLHSDQCSQTLHLDVGPDHVIYVLTSILHEVAIIYDYAQSVERALKTLDS
jgi:hypothetical protein